MRAEFSLIHDADRADCAPPPDMVTLNPFAAVAVTTPERPLSVTANDELCDIGTFACMVNDS